MATPDIPFIPSIKSQEALVNFSTVIAQANINNQRQRFLDIDLAYIREQDQTKEHKRAQLANKYGDSNRLQNITIPVVMPQVESAVTYQASVFLTGVPMFGVAADPEFIDAALMLESIIETEQIRGDWVRNLLMFFRDGFKYNISAIECSWDTMSTVALETNLAQGIQAKPKNVLWSGNKLTRINPYNFFYDTKVAPSQIYIDGDYAGKHELMSRIKLKQFVANLKYRMNMTEAFESSSKGASVLGIDTSYYYMPDINPQVSAELKDGDFNWMSWAKIAGGKQEINYSDNYLVTTIYARVIPADFNLNLPERNTPQIMKLILVNLSVLIYAEKQTNAHNYIPIVCGVPNEDGLQEQTKTLAENSIPFQQVTSALMNSVIASRRRAISDRVIYDPSRISEAQINSPNPSAKIPVRPTAYGKPVGEAVYPFPFRDEQAGLVLGEIQQLLAIGNEVNGQNKAKQGQFVKGNKTQSEFQTVMNNANGRDQQTAILYEAQAFTPLKEIIKTNILQYQGAEKLFSKSKNQAVQVDPQRMRDAVMEFKLSDGLVPTDKVMDAEAFTISLQTLGSSPQLASGYNIAPLFSYLMKQRGADLTPFEKTPEQIAYEEAVLAWQQAVAAFAKGLESGQVTQEQLPPQPTPEQFGYTPAGNNSAATPARTTQNVNNITNNITNNRA